MLSKSKLFPPACVISAVFGISGCGGPLTPPLFNYSEVVTTYKSGEYGVAEAKPIEVEMKSFLKAEQISCSIEYTDESGALISETSATFTDNGPIALENTHTGIYDDVNAMAPGLNIPVCNVTRKEIEWPQIPGTFIYVFTEDNVEAILEEIMDEGAIPPITSDVVIDLPDPALEPEFTVGTSVFPSAIAELKESLSGVGVTFALNSASTLPNGLGINSVTGNVAGVINTLDETVPGVYPDIVINAVIISVDEEGAPIEQIIPLDSFGILVNAFEAESDQAQDESESESEDEDSQEDEAG